MVTKTDLLLGAATLLFFAVGGLVDYWQSAAEHKKRLPTFLKDYFAVFWLILYTGIIPFFLVVFASGFNTKTIILYLGFLFLGSSLWDLLYSLLDTRRLISSQSGYFFLRGRNYGLTEKQLFAWHILLLIGAILILNRAVSIR